MSFQKSSCFCTSGFKAVKSLDCEDKRLRPSLFHAPRRLPLKLRRTCIWRQEEIWERRERRLCLQTLWRCCWKARDAPLGFILVRRGRHNLLLRVYRYRSCDWDPPAYSGDVLRPRPPVHAHHSPAAGMWPASKQNSGQVHPAERLPQQGVHGTACTARLRPLRPCTPGELESVL